MAHVGVSVSESTKADWEEYVEQSDHGNMSELVRVAVRKEMQRSGGNDDVPREVEQRLSEVAETQDSLRSQMNDLVDGFEEVADATTDYPDHIKELGHDIAGELDEVHADHFNEAQSEVKDDLRSLVTNHPDSPSVGEVADALDYLESNLSYIRSEPQGPSDYYRVRGRREVSRNVE